MTARYAIQYISPEGIESYHMQGLPSVPEGSSGFEFAVLYASMDHAIKATRIWKMRTRIDALKERGWKINILTVVTFKFETVEI